MNKIELLINGLKELNINPSSRIIEQFELYYDLLIEWNNKINLTSITKEDEVIIKHFLDSVLVIKAIDFQKVNTVIDIGTGAGFPGIPLKIIFPEVKLTLLDSVNKKVNFLNEVCEKLELSNIKCVHERAEDYANNPDYREKFDLVVSRAVSNLSTLSEYCLPFLKISGIFVAYKAENCDLEIEDAKHGINILGGKISNKEQFRIPPTDIIRTYVCIKKVASTPKAYPRKAGIPAKKPL